MGKNKVVGIRADDVFFDRAKKCADYLDMSRNKFIIMVVNTYCGIVENEQKREEERDGRD